MYFYYCLFSEKMIYECVIKIHWGYNDGNPRGKLRKYYGRARIGEPVFPSRPEDFWASSVQRSGKTTVIRVLAGLLNKTAGVAESSASCPEGSQPRCRLYAGEIAFTANLPSASSYSIWRASAALMRKTSTRGKA